MLTLNALFQLVSPFFAIFGLYLLEQGDYNALMYLAFAATLLWLRLLQPLRGSKSIGPLIPIMIRMLFEVLKFTAVLMIMVSAWAVALHGLLQQSSNTFEAFGNATQLGIPWTSEYADLTTTFKTLLRAMLGDFSTDFAYATHSSSAQLLFGLYIIAMMLMLMNLLITLLMKRYEEVDEIMHKQFAFVRASAVFWLQDAVLDSELPPPFNLLQVVHPRRDKLAWLTWLLIGPPFFFVFLLLSWAVVSAIYVPYMAFSYTQENLIKLTGQVSGSKLRGTNIKYEMDADIEFLEELEGEQDDGDDDNLLRHKLKDAMKDIVKRGIGYSLAFIPISLAVILFGAAHWVLLILCSTIDVVFAYWHIVRRVGLAVGSVCSCVPACSCCAKDSKQSVSDWCEATLREEAESEARQNVKRLSENYAACVDYISELDGEMFDGHAWTNNSQTGSCTSHLSSDSCSPTPPRLD